MLLVISRDKIKLQDMYLCYLLSATFSISLAKLISRFVIASTSNDFKESLTVLRVCSSQRVSWKLMGARFGRKIIKMAKVLHLHLAYHLASERAPYTTANPLLRVSDCLPDRGPISNVNLMFQPYQKFYHIYHSDVP
jgi:hypothetical protein